MASVFVRAKQDLLRVGLRIGAALRAGCFMSELKLRPPRNHWDASFPFLHRL